MAEDGIGWGFFDEGEFVIANEAAVEASARHLVDKMTAFDAAFEHIRASAAPEAVQRAAEMKAERSLDRSVDDTPDTDILSFIEGDNFFLG
jgi:hypothetical protein